MKPVFGVINQHDRDRFEIHMLSDGGDPAEASGYVDHADDRIWQINSLSNEQLARHIAAAGLDVLVDLNGYSAQRRLPLFMHRPARRQIGWFNMFATTGMAAFDCAGRRRMPCCRRRRSRSIASASIACLAATWRSTCAIRCRTWRRRLVWPMGYITFGCLGSAYKLTDTVIEAWARIMARRPGARLLLKNGTLDDASNRSDCCGGLRGHGIAAERLLLEGGDEHYEFLRAYARIDVALDTFPYNGGTTTTEALWQGVPVLTFNGDRWASRTSRSLLLAAGLPEWVCNDREGYINAAIRLAHAADTPARLARLRGGLREQVRRSAACDTAGLCRELERLYLRGLNVGQIEVCADRSGQCGRENSNFHGVTPTSTSSLRVYHSATTARAGGGV